MLRRAPLRWSTPSPSTSKICRRVSQASRYPALDYKLTADQARGLFSVVGDADGDRGDQGSHHSQRSRADGKPSGQPAPAAARPAKFKSSSRSRCPTIASRCTIDDSLVAIRPATSSTAKATPRAATGPTLPQRRRPLRRRFRRPLHRRHPAGTGRLRRRPRVHRHQRQLSFTIRRTSTSPTAISRSPCSLIPSLVGRAQLGVHDSVFAGNF